MNQVRVRFAPSPTGLLNLGGARTALFNWLFAQAYDGTLILRSEDIDQERSSVQAEESIMADLAWLGISWDEGPDKEGPYSPYRQSERCDVYARFVKRLIDDGFAYQCFCSEEDLAEQRREMLSHGETPRYSGRCRNLTDEDRARLTTDGRTPVVRFRVPGGKRIEFTDLIRGQVEFSSERMTDFIIVKADGLPTYNFAVVLDDHLMGITHVIRGDEHLANTARQLLLYEVLGWRPPQFAHLPSLTDEEGRLSATVGLDTVDEYRKRGYLPEAMANFLLLLGWEKPGKATFSLQEAGQDFRLEQVNKESVMFSPDKLREVNAYYLKKSSPERVLELALPHLQQAGYVNDPTPDERVWLLQLADAMRGELSEVAEISDKASFFFQTKVVPQNKRARQVLKEEQVPTVFAAFEERMDNLPEFKATYIRSELRQLCKDLNLTTRRVYLPLRIALTGRLRGPEMFQIITLLGRERVKDRLQTARKFGVHNV
ncbi:MAG TPA: glutamate--tRNA ligase [Firmicutes bacterium]|nr:glutamate--tRNA ligase [Bacillota bacterium]